MFRGTIARLASTRALPWARLVIAPDSVVVSTPARFRLVLTTDHTLSMRPSYSILAGRPLRIVTPARDEYYFRTVRPEQLRQALVAAGWSVGEY